MSEFSRDGVYLIAKKDVSVSLTYNEYIANRKQDKIVDINSEYRLIGLIEDHVTNVNKILNEKGIDAESYRYLTERVVYWSNILLHEFDVYVDFIIPSPKRLFLDE